MRPLPILLAAVLAVLVVTAGAPAAAPAAVPQLKADFTIDPAVPQAGQAVTFTNTSTGGAGTTTPHWDLDDDGEYDNGTANTVTRTFGPGQHTVRLLVLSVGPTTQKDQVSKTFTVTAPPTTTPPPTTSTPPATDTPPTTTQTSTTPAPAPAPTPPAAAPADNQAPQARIDLACGSLNRTAQLCLTQYARVGAPKTFDASPSRDADGRIVRYEWDLDGDGRYETDTGTSPKATRTYGDMDPLTVHLRVTDDLGATGETALALKKTEPACQPRMAYKMLSAVSSCLRHYRYDAAGGKPKLTTDVSLHSGRGYSADEYRTDRPLILNGIGITPAAGRTVSIRIIDAKDDGHPRVDVVGAGVATIRKGEDVVTVDEGGIHWRLDGDVLQDVIMPAGQKLGHLPVVGLSQMPRLTLGAGSTFAFVLRMPQQFGAATSDRPATVTLGGARALAASRHAVARASAADAPLHFEVREAVLGPIKFHALELDYDGRGFWEIKADVTLPPPAGARVRAGAGLLDGAFNYASADVEFQDQGLNIIGPVFLKRIAFRVEVEPKRSACVPHVGVEQRPTVGGIGVVTAPGMPAEPTTVDYGVPTFALCGEVGLIVGPTVAGESALRLDGGLGFAMFDDRPALMRVFGELSLVGLPLHDASLELHTDGYIEARAHAKWVWPGVALAEGSIGVEMLGTQFNAHGRVDACLPVVDWCAVGARAVASNKGVAVCLKVDFEVDTWEPGIGYRWGETPTIYFAGCELGPYKNRIRRAHAADADAEQAISIGGGLPGAAIALEGRDGAPKVTLVGPDGERVTTPADGKGLEQGRFLVLQDPHAKLTQIAIVKPAGGTWRVIPQEGSTPIVDLKTADGVERPEVKAEVVKRGGRRYVEYDVRAQPGQTVTFAERGASAGRILGRARSGKGRIRFTPADGKAERRRIVAIVEQDGLPSAQVAVARYRAPGPLRPARPRGVRLVRRGPSLVVSWAKDGAPAHVVTVATSDGRRVVRRVDGRRRIALPGIDRRLRATATVKAVGRNGMLGAVVSARLAARR